MLVRDSFRGKGFVNSLIDLPFALPTIVAGLTLLALYGPRSPVGIDVAYTQIAVILALLFVTLPFVVRAVQPVLMELDREMEEAAASLGASNFTIFRRIILPNLLPAILAGVGLAFARAIGEFGSLVLITGNLPFETEVSSVFIFGQIESDRVDRRGRRVGRAAGDLAASSCWASRRCRAGGRRPWTSERGPAEACALARSRLGYLFALLAAPVGLVFYRTFENGFDAAWEAVTTPEAMHAFQLTMVMVAVAVPLNTIFGITCALLHRAPQVPRALALLNALIDLPFAISPVVIGLALILVYGQTGWFGDWLAEQGIQIIFSVPGMILATMFVSLPFVVREVIPVLREVGTEQEQAAQTLGASGWQTFWRITLPSIRWGVSYGVVLATARALGEFGAVAVVSGKLSGETETATLFVEQRFQNFDLAGAYAASMVLAILALSTLLLMNLISPRREEG